MFTETWLKPGTSNSEILSPSFNIFRKDRVRTVSYGGGVLIASQNTIPTEEVVLPTNGDIEFCCTCSELQSCKVFLTVSYIPPQSSSELFTLHLNAIRRVMNLLRPKDQIFICGDFNLPNVSWSINDQDHQVMLPSSPNPSDMDILNDLSSLGLVQVNHFLNSNGRILDLIFTDDSKSVKLRRSLPLVCPEDIYHPTLELLLNLTYPQPTVRPIFERFKFNFKKTNLTKLKGLLQSVDWHLTMSDIGRVRNAYDLDVMVGKFTTQLLSFVRKCTPLSKNLKPNEPKWFNNNLRIIRNLKSKLYKKCKKSSLPTDWVNYTNVRYRYHALSKLAYSNYLFKVKSRLKVDPNSFWDFINSKRNLNHSPSFLTFDDETAYADSSISNLFAKFFSSVYANDTIGGSYPYELPHFDFSFPRFDTSLVAEFASRIKSSFSAGPDNVPSFIVKSCAEELALPLSILFNLSLDSGFFPELWKKSFIIPIHKSGSRNNISNYRGIAKLSAIPKLFEQLLTEHLTFQCKPLISPFQHGFLNGSSTVTNLLQFVTHTISAFQNKMQTDVLYTDFSKAFDKINHNLLLLKLQLYGFPARLTTWLSSYLSDRTQSVIFNGSISSEFSVTSGVPQGSHIGPLLFLIFINDLPSRISNSKILMFADDVKLYFSFNTANAILQDDLNELTSWCRTNGMTLNLSKCKQMTYCRNLKPLIVSYTIDGTPLDSVTSFNDLGVQFDPKLRFHLHIDRIVNKGFCVLGFIKRWAKEFNDPYVTKLLFTSLVRPILEYGCLIWSPSYQCYVDRIESVQKQFLIFCLRGLGWENNFNLPSYVSRLKLISLPSLSSRRVMLSISFIFKLLTGDVRSQLLLNRVNICIPIRSCRNYKLIKVDKFNCNYLNANPFLVACKNFNDLYFLIDFNQSLFLMKRAILDHLN